MRSTINSYGKSIIGSIALFVPLLNIKARVDGEVANFKFFVSAGALADRDVREAKVFAKKHAFMGIGRAEFLLRDCVSLSDVVSCVSQSYEDNEYEDDYHKLRRFWVCLGYYYFILWHCRNFLYYRLCSRYF